MDITQIIQCLVADGSLSQEEANELLPIIGKFPVLDTSALIASLLILLLQKEESGGGGSDEDLAFAGPPLSVISITSANATDNKALTSIPEDATKAVVTPVGNNIIYTNNSVNPVGSVGHFAALGSNFIVQNLSGFRFHTESGVASTIYVAYYP